MVCCDSQTRLELTFEQRWDWGANTLVHWKLCVLLSLPQKQRGI